MFIAKLCIQLDIPFKSENCHVLDILICGDVFETNIQQNGYATKRLKIALDIHCLLIYTFFNLHLLNSWYSQELIVVENIYRIDCHEVVQARALLISVSSPLKKL